MIEFLGLDVVAIHAPQDRNALEIHVIAAEGQVGVVRFANDDGTPVTVEFSAVSIQLISDTYITLIWLLPVKRQNASLRAADVD